MEFEVYFKSKSGYSVNRHYTTLGWLHAQKIREAAGCKVPYDRIDNCSQSYHRDVGFKVPCETAEKLEVFKLEYMVKVTVPDGGLNRYISLVPEIIRDEETGEVTRASMEYELDRDAVLRDWIDAGCPLEWNPAESGEVEEVQE